MPVPSHVARKLREVLGTEAGEGLVNWMDDTTAVRADVAELRHEMQVGFARIEAHVDRTRADLATEIERSKADLMKVVVCLLVRSRSRHRGARRRAP
ncbi:MAG: hypothetical protein WD801_05870, partial [Gemmatimonadaceae bacterium]